MHTDHLHFLNEMDTVTYRYRKRYIVKERYFIQPELHICHLMLAAAKSFDRNSFYIIKGKIVKTLLFIGGNATEN